MNILNIQITKDQLAVIEEMIAFDRAEISVLGAIQEMIADDIIGIERTLNQLKELKASQLQLINRPKLYLVK